MSQPPVFNFFFGGGAPAPAPPSAFSPWGGDRGGRGRGGGSDRGRGGRGRGGGGHFNGGPGRGGRKFNGGRGRGGGAFYRGRRDQLTISLIQTMCMTFKPPTEFDPHTPKLRGSYKKKNTPITTTNSSSSLQ
ncbi:hypothetical protein PRIPAC_83108 [Pristionchus pacificus]|uniref:Uncharacterized protein n=1 Tax=Pristionchus pacificus TaxID=54126 RepID=A0A454Y5M8_PRIPA|nr:hypothetical protein PRIPAC_83108 [Pristionchus pacificus]|eukprot:PDM66654.1 hypothetical protein PRIPAC_48071 [Pristionchus pacificus]